MRLVFSVSMNNRHRQNTDLLGACVRDGVTVFNRRSRADAQVNDVRILTDDAELFMMGVGREVLRLTKKR
jgi:hypothetical protein